VISVGPGYDDSKIRPWNSQNIKKRGKDGEYFEKGLNSGSFSFSID